MTLILLMWHAEMPVYYNILQKASCQQRIYVGDGLFTRPARNKTSFTAYSGPKAVVYLIPANYSGL